jgi:hypothetical protein
MWKIPAHTSTMTFRQRVSSGRTSNITEPATRMKKTRPMPMVSATGAPDLRHDRSARVAASSVIDWFVATGTLARLCGDKDSIKKLHLAELLASRRSMR